jgi:hypothetical protein
MKGVDDHPANNHVLGDMFERLLGVDIKKLVRLIQLMKAEHVHRPTVIYCGVERPVPPGAFGLTIRPDELLHLVIDVCERDWARTSARK